jgi:hypothetical protein
MQAEQIDDEKGHGDGQEDQAAGPFRRQQVINERDEKRPQVHQLTEYFGFG